jgi:hypothetical protein
MQNFLSSKKKISAQSYFFARKRSHRIFCSLAADKLRAGARGNHRCLAKSRYACAHGNGNCLQMHTDKGKTYIYTRVGADALNGAGRVKACPNARSPRAARVGLRKHADLAKTVLFCARALNYYSAVKMLTALRREEYSPLTKNGRECVKYSICRIGRRVLADSAARNLRGGAAYHENISRTKSCRIKKLKKELFGVFFYIFIKFFHFSYSVSKFNRYMHPHRRRR